MLEFQGKNLKRHSRAERSENLPASGSPENAKSVSGQKIIQLGEKIFYESHEHFFGGSLFFNEGW